ncbi:hypothetical protein GCK32_008828 [Trichostrongylus colubriformis]|uniref:C2H2-type domain-containing protein n=1 Tax=Trichostrongylus colubriformis TaxID=6319 RepID=A0AAN8FDC6_TRICO
MKPNSNIYPRDREIRDENTKVLKPISDNYTADRGSRDENSEAMNYLCPECGTNKGHHIYDHLVAVHFYSKDEIERVKMERRGRKLMRGTDEVYPCDVCGLLCKNKRTLAKHKKRKHADQESTDVQRCLLCPLCEEQIKSHWDLIEHVNEEHSTLNEHCVVEAESFDDKKKIRSGLRLFCQPSFQFLFFGICRQRCRYM